MNQGKVRSHIPSLNLFKSREYSHFLKRELCSRSSPMHEHACNPNPTPCTYLPFVSDWNEILETTNYRIITINNEVCNLTREACLVKTWPCISVHCYLGVIRENSFVPHACRLLPFPKFIWDSLKTRFSRRVPNNDPGYQLCPMTYSAFILTAFPRRFRFCHL